MLAWDRIALQRYLANDIPHRQNRFIVESEHKESHLALCNHTHTPS